VHLADGGGRACRFDSTREREFGEVSDDEDGGGSILSDSTTAASAKICLLDDDPCVLKGTGRLLRSAGWETESFSDPHLFLDYVQQHRPHLAVIDMWMPLMHGLEVQKNLRRLSSTTRVIVVTARNDPVVRAEAMKAGASAFCLKPVDGELLMAVEAALGS